MTVQHSRIKAREGIPIVDSNIAEDETTNVKTVQDDKTVEPNEA
jgi:hypothetical protein